VATVETVLERCGGSRGNVTEMCVRDLDDAPISFNG